MGKSMDRDLLPWILGAALLATGALAAAIQWTGQARSGPATIAAARPGPAATVLAAPTTVTAPAHASAAAPVGGASFNTAAALTSAATGTPPSASALDALSATAAARAAAAEPSTGDPELPSGEVWECVENGQKVFSDRRCGRDATVKQLPALNTMEVPPPGNPYASYPPAYRDSASYPYPPPARDDQNDYGDSASDFYPAPWYGGARDARAHRLHPDVHPQRAASSRATVGARSPH